MYLASDGIEGRLLRPEQAVAALQSNFGEALADESPKRTWSSPCRSVMSWSFSTAKKKDKDMPAHQLSIGLKAGDILFREEGPGDGAYLVKKAASRSSKRRKASGSLRTSCTPARFSARWPS